MDPPTPIVFLSRRSHVSLRAIDATNWRTVAQLMVDKDQTALVSASTLEAMCEHQFNGPQSIIRAIYADESPIGFFSLCLHHEHDNNGSSCSSDSSGSSGSNNSEIDTPEKSNSLAHLRLFMIDRRNQGLGFGSKAIQLLQEDIATHQVPFQHTTGLILTTNTFALVNNQDSPAHFFELVGFRHRNDRKEMIWTAVAGTIDETES